MDVSPIANQGDGVSVSSVAEAPRPSGLSKWKIFGASLFAVGATSTAAQLATALALGAFDGDRAAWSTGGLLALVIAIYLARKRLQDWLEWWRRIRVWLAITAVVAFGVTVASYQPTTSTQGLPEGPTPALVSEWAKVTEPSRTVQVETGRDIITMTQINPCYLGQAWGDCIGAMTDEYNYACVGRSLNFEGRTLCDNYESQIVRMQGEGGAGWTVSSLGSGGTLTVAPEMRSERLPPTKVVAVCYFWYLGECE